MSTYFPGAGEIERKWYVVDAAGQTLGRLATSELERRHRRGYEAKPVRRGEFDAWETEQAWPE